jgi:regulator of protease activity HflC (stomatin/prohibitin superfamily)
MVWRAPHVPERAPQEIFMTGFDIFAIVFVALVILTLLAGVKTVPQGYDWTIERFGKYTRTLDPGLNLIVPYIDRVGRKMNMMEQVIDIPKQEVITKDNATVSVDGVAFYQVFDAAKASYEVANLNQAIVTLTMTNIRSVMGAMDLDQVLSHRDEINERLLRVVDAAVSPWGAQGQPHRDQGHRAAGRPGAGDGPADEGRAREARRHPSG